MPVFGEKARTTTSSNKHDLMAIAICPKCSHWVVEENIRDQSYTGIANIVKTFTCHNCLFHRFQIFDVCSVRDMTLETFLRTKPAVRIAIVGKNPIKLYSQRVGIDNYSMLAKAFESQRLMINDPTKSSDDVSRLKCALIAREALIRVRDTARRRMRMPEVGDGDIPDICRLEDTLCERHKKVNAVGVTAMENIVSCWIWDIGERVLANRISHESWEKILHELCQRKIGTRTNKGMLLQLMATGASIKEQIEIADFVSGASVMSFGRKAAQC